MRILFELIQDCLQCYMLSVGNGMGSVDKTIDKRCGGVHARTLQRDV